MAKINDGEQLGFDLVTDSTDLPTPVYKRDRKKLSKAYERALKELGKLLLKELSVKDPSNIGVINTVNLMKQVELIILQMNGDVKAQVRDVVEQAFQHGQAVHLMKVAGVETYDEALKQAGITHLSKSMIDSIVADTFNDLLVATKYMEDSLKITVRKVVSKVLQLKLAQNTGLNETSQLLMKELTKKGLSKTITQEAFVGIVDKAGRRWNLKTYAEMVVTTKTQQAHVEGIKFEGTVSGYDLAIISNHGAKDDCRKWENTIISLNGQTKGFITYDQARRTKEIFHPNCEHTLLPIRSVDLVHKDILKAHKKNMKKNVKAVEDLKK